MSVVCDRNFGELNCPKHGRDIMRHKTEYYWKSLILTALEGLDRQSSDYESNLVSFEEVITRIRELKP